MFRRSYWRYEDTVKVYLARTDFPNVIVDSAKSVMGTNAVTVGLLFNRALSGDYYRVVKHRNSIETWSALGTTYTRGSSTNYNFIPNNASYGNNMSIVSTSPFYKGMYSGDIEQNGIVDLADVIGIYNDAVNFVTGYELTDLNGNFTTDLTDLLYAYNNATSFVQVVRPPGAEPLPSPLAENISKSDTFESDADRQKHELTQRLMELQKTDISAEYVPNWGVDPKDVERLRKMKIDNQKNIKLNVKADAGAGN
ncbi:MAG: hypothetical protein R2942_10630 [Ignavibacteria bacterium]